MTRRIALLLALTLAVLAAAVPVAAHGGAKAKNLPTQIDLPAGFRPEGITAGRRSTFFVGSLANGAIYRGSFRTGAGGIFIAGVTGRVAAGTDYERRHDRLWVAGGPTHQVRAYDASSGALLATYDFPTSGFLNDLVATRDAVYVTDSNNAQLAVIPLGNGGTLPAPGAAFLRPLSGFQMAAGQFNANGIDVAGRWLIVVNSFLGQLYRVDPSTGASTLIALSGGEATSGDGLEVVGRKIHVVRNQINRVAIFEANRTFTAATWKRDLTAPAGVLDVPTTAVVTRKHVWVVNARFGNPNPNTVPYWITRLR